jgi:hypothetical protein
MGQICTPDIIAVMIARIPENIASLNMVKPISFSVSGLLATINLTSVIGASDSLVAVIL